MTKHRTKGAAPREDAPGPDLTGTITSFTATSPTTVTMDGEDTAMLAVGDTIALEPLTGDPAAIAALGASANVVAILPTQLDIDLSAANVEGLTADFSRDAADVGPSNPPNHQADSMSPGPGSMFHPSPGVGSVPTEDWVPPEGWTPPAGWQAPPPGRTVQPGDQFPTPKEDRPDTIPGGRELADQMKDTPIGFVPPRRRPTQLPADPPRHK